MYLSLEEFDVIQRKTSPKFLNFNSIVQFNYVAGGETVLYGGDLSSDGGGHFKPSLFLRKASIRKRRVDITVFASNGRTHTHNYHVTVF